MSVSKYQSEGKNGKIEKIIVFTPTHVPNMYSLGFGDANYTTGNIETQVVSNNGDVDKVLATVADAILKFTDFYPNSRIFATGVTPSRNRLYRMVFHKYWAEIASLFTVMGYYQNGWESFIPNRDYQAFLIERT
jgi:hypothetical protein